MSVFFNCIEKFKEFLTDIHIENIDEFNGIINRLKQTSKVNRADLSKVFYTMYEKVLKSNSTFLPISEILEKYSIDKYKLNLLNKYIETLKQEVSFIDKKKLENILEVKPVLLLSALLIFSLSSCHNATPRIDSSYNYGDLSTIGISHINNELWQTQFNQQNAYSTDLLTLQQNIESQLICPQFESDGRIPNFLNGPQHYCDATKAFINEQESLFGFNSNINLNNFITDANSSVLNNRFGVSGVIFESINYSSPGAPYMFAGNSVAKRILSGLIVIPTTYVNNQKVPLDESKIRGIVLYYHPTILSKGGVPSGSSNFNNVDNLMSLDIQWMLASVFASQGYIVVAPDYVGQGYDVDETHPYVMFPTVNAQSGIFMLKAVNQYLSTNYNISFANLESSNLYITSYSEGGAYAVRASELLQSTYSNFLQNIHLNLKNTIGIEGAYDMTNEMQKFAFADVITYPESQNVWQSSPGLNCDINQNECDKLFYGMGSTLNKIELQQFLDKFAQLNIVLSKPSLSTNMINTIIHYDYTPVAYQLGFTHDFANQDLCLSPPSFQNSIEQYYKNFFYEKLHIGEPVSFSPFEFVSCNQIPTNQGGLGSSYNVSELFSSANLTNNQIGMQLLLSTIAKGYFIGSESNINDVFTQLNNGQTFNSIKYFVELTTLTDPDVQSLINLSNVGSWQTKSPMTLLNMRYDSTVTPLNFNSLCSSITTSNNSNNLIKCISVDNTNLWSWNNLGDFNIMGTNVPYGIPEYLGHGGAERIMQLSALHFLQVN